MDALVDGQAERAFSLLNVLLESGEQRIGVLALITRQYRQMMYVKDMQESRMPQPQMAKALGVPPFALGQLTRRAGRRRTRAARSAETGENRVGAAGTRRRSAAENLGQINIAVLIQRHADADLGIARA